MQHNQTASAHQASMRELKSAVRALDWEISEAILLRFNQEVEGLLNTLHHDPLAVKLLKILNIVGKYVRAKHVDAHPMSMRLLQSCYDLLEELVGDTGSLSKEDKNKRVADIVAEYKQLKQAVQGKSTRTKGAARAPAASAEQIRAIVREELKRFKQELLRELAARRS